MEMMWKRLLTIGALAALLAGCASASAMELTPTPQPPQADAVEVARAPRAGGETVVASGQVLPAREARLSFTTAGRVAAVTVAEGDPVATGDLLIALDVELLEAQIAQAEATVQAARAQLPLLEAGPRPGEIGAAQAQVAAAEAALEQAGAQRAQLLTGETRAAIAAAEAQVATAEAEAKAALIAYDQMAEHDLEDWEKEEIILRLQAAESNRAAAEAQVTLVKQRSSFQVRVADAAIHTAEAQRDVARAQLALLYVGPASEAIAAAEAAVAQAEAAVQATRVMRDQALLHAPFDGEIVALDVAPGETVIPGQEVLVLAELHRLRVETTDLSERDVVQVSMGQQAAIYVEALDVEIAGKVSDIAPQANTVGGDVVYAVTIDLDEQPSDLRWGMSVEVEIVIQ
jgi:HlyD family secretion protein